MSEYINVLDLASSKGYNPSEYSLNENGSTSLHPSETQQIIELALLQKWLRDTHKIFVTVDHTYGEVCESSPKIYTLGANQKKPNEYAYKWQGEFYFSYEMALLQGIKAALQII